jgi:hypothetical protein
LFTNVGGRGAPVKQVQAVQAAARSWRALAAAQLDTAEWLRYKAEMRRLTQLGSKLLPSSWGFHSLSDSWTLLLALGGVVALVNFGTAAWDDYQVRSIPEKASATAAVLYEAVRSCGIAALPKKLEECVVADARLPEEKAAAIRAQEAVQAREVFYERCKKRNATEDCTELLRRAWVIYDNQDRARQRNVR